MEVNDGMGSMLMIMRWMVHVPTEHDEADLCFVLQRSVLTHFIEPIMFEHSDIVLYLRVRPLPEL